MDPALAPPTALDPAQGARIAGLIDLLLTVAYADGLLHADERAFVRDYLDRLIAHVAATPDAADAWRAHVEVEYARIDAEVAALAAEVVAAGDDSFVRTRLKVRAVARFRAFAPDDQEAALALLHALVQADGEVAAAERDLYEELFGYFHAAPASTLGIAAAAVPPLIVAAPHPNELKAFVQPLLEPLEQRYASEPARLAAQLAGDLGLVAQALAGWERQRAAGAGRLAGVADVAQLPTGASFLDGHVHVLRPDRPVELIVLGDLHGCYACLKAALLQSDFVARAERYRADPANHPDVKLVLLGDYLDRGRFGFEGVLRAALQLLVALPEHVILLRGNHELLARVDDGFVSRVYPAESLAQLVPHATAELLDGYVRLCDAMPAAFLFERTLFVHGGIPRDETLAARYRDLSSLGDPELRFEMMWSDPVETDVVPVELQRQTPRFSFGRQQFRAFMARVGCHTMVRGHEQVEQGFATVFDLGDRRLHTLFSAGGHDNPDLPEDSGYRRVTPMALTVRSDDGPLRAAPWPIRYQAFGGAARNGLYR